MLSARFRVYSDFFVVPIGRTFAKTGLNPNTLTLVGLLLSAGAAGAFACKNLAWALALLLFASLFDMLDGAVARASGKVTNFGGYLDSVTDRYSDALILIGLAMYMEAHYVLVMIVIVGSMLVSYSKAKAETLIEKCDVGLAERGERLILLIFATLMALAGRNIFYEVLLLLAVLTHLTVLQRVLYTRGKI